MDKLIFNIFFPIKLTLICHFCRCCNGVCFANVLVIYVNCLN